MPSPRVWSTAWQTPASCKPPRPAPPWPSTHCMLLPLPLPMLFLLPGMPLPPHTTPVVPPATWRTLTSHFISCAFSLEGLHKGQEWNQICILEATLGMNSPWMNQRGKTEQGARVRLLHWQDHDRTSELDEQWAWVRAMRREGFRRQVQHGSEIPGRCLDSTWEGNTRKGKSYLLPLNILHCELAHTLIKTIFPKNLL